MKNKLVYEFEVHLIINDVMSYKLQKVRIVADDYCQADKKLIEIFEILDNVKLIERYFIDQYFVYE